MQETALGRKQKILKVPLLPINMFPVNFETNTISLALPGRRTRGHKILHQCDDKQQKIQSSIPVKRGENVNYNAAITC